MPLTVITDSPFDALKVKLSLSISLADNSRVKEVSSSMDWASIADNTGASLIGLTVNVKLPEPDAWPSLATTFTIKSPL